MDRLFEAIYAAEGKKRRARGHDDVIAKLREMPVNQAAVDLVDGYRGESQLLLPLLAGTLTDRLLAQRWLVMAFSVPPNLGTEWSEWGIGDLLAKWKCFCRETGFETPEDGEYLSLSDDVRDAWGEFDNPRGKAIENAIQIGALAGGDSIWVLPDGETWLASAEPDELPFLHLFGDLAATITAVEAALEWGELTNDPPYLWRWNDRTFEQGADEWELASG